MAALLGTLADELIAGLEVARRGTPNEKPQKVATLKAVHRPAGGKGDSDVPRYWSGKEGEALGGL